MKKIFLLVSSILLLLLLISCSDDNNINEKIIKDSFFNNNELTEVQIYEMFEPIIDNQLLTHPNRKNILIGNPELKVLIVSMIIHETGYLKSQLVQNNNLLGIKKLKKRPIVKLQTTEYINGKNVLELDDEELELDDLIENMLKLEDLDSENENELDTDEELELDDEELDDEELELDDEELELDDENLELDDDTEWHEFASFYDFDDCIYNWISLISNSDYYTNFRTSTNLSTAIFEISRVYATDPSYSSKIYKYVNIIETDLELKLNK